MLEFSPFENQPDDWLAEADQADGGGNGEEKCEPQGPRQGAAKSGRVADRRALRDQGQRDRGDRDAEDAERQLHQPKRVGKPAHRAVALVAREGSIHEHVHLHRTRRDDGRPHEPQDRRDTFVIAPLKIGSKTEPDARQRRELDGELKETAEQGAERQPEQRAGTERRVEPPAKRDTADDGAEVEKAGCHRGRAEDVAGVEHAHRQRGERHEQDEWKHHARERNGERGFFRREPTAEHRDQLRRKSDAEQRDRAHEDNGERGDLVCQPPGGGVAFGRDLF